jgi:hypothetical protein
MGLAQIQHVLARLYTDRVLRERFFGDPQGVGEELGLTRDEMQQLAHLSEQQVDFFVQSLQNKRLKEVCKQLPLTYGVLGRRFGEMFGRYAHTHVPKGLRKHQEDALAFSAFLERVAREEGLEPAWVVDLMRYEAAWLKAADPACRWTVRWFRYPVNKLVRGVAQGGGMLLPQEQVTVALWTRISRRSRLRHIVLSLPRLLRMRH